MLPALCIKLVGKAALVPEPKAILLNCLALHHPIEHLAEQHRGLDHGVPTVRGVVLRCACYAQSIRVRLISQSCKQHAH